VSLDFQFNLSKQVKDIEERIFYRFARDARSVRADQYRRFECTDSRSRTNFHLRIAR